MKYGDPLGGRALTGDISTAYWRKVDKRGPNECWPWTGAQQRLQYPRGQIRFDNKTRIATRVGWELIHGEPVPSGLCVLHTCDNGMCMNPAHWFLGTQRDNMRDMWAKQRGSAGRPADPIERTTIQTMLADGKSAAEISRELNIPYHRTYTVARQQAGYVVKERKKSFASVTPEQDALIREMLAAGLSQRDIEATTGVGRWIVQQIATGKR